MASSDLREEVRARCAAGALSRAEHLTGLAEAGFADVTVTHEVAEDLHGAVVAALEPGAAT